MNSTTLERSCRPHPGSPTMGSPALPPWASTAPTMCGWEIRRPLLPNLRIPGGALIVKNQPTSAKPLPQLAADGSGNMWFVFAGDNGINSVCKVPPYSGLGTIQVSTCYVGGLPTDASSYTPIGANAQGLAFDGAGGLWIAGSSLLDAMGNYVALAFLFLFLMPYRYATQSMAPAMCGCCSQTTQFWNTSALPRRW